MIRNGMVVRTNDGRKVGRVAAVGSVDFVIESGILFKHHFTAPLADVVEVRDDEVICRPLELPEQDRDIHEMPFGCAETDDELENKRDEAAMFETLRQPHPH
jgi:hypothetical protein